MPTESYIPYKSNDKEYIETLEKQCKCYEEQLKNKDKQIEELRTAIKAIVNHMK